jgi:hypothetical protein
MKAMHTMYENMAERGIVSTHVRTMFLAMPHLTAENLRVAPTPIIDPVIA